MYGKPSKLPPGNLYKPSVEEILVFFKRLGYAPYVNTELSFNPGRVEITVCDGRVYIVVDAPCVELARVFAEEKSCLSLQEEPSVLYEDVMILNPVIQEPLLENEH